MPIHLCFDIAKEIIEMLDIKDCQILLLTCRLFSQICLAKIRPQRMHMLKNYQMDLLNGSIIVSSSTVHSATLQRVLVGEYKYHEVDLIEAISDQFEEQTRKTFCFVLLDPNQLPFLPSPPIWSLDTMRLARPCSLHQLVNSIFYVGKGDWKSGGPVGSVLEARRSRSDTPQISKSNGRKNFGTMGKRSAPISIHLDKICWLTAVCPGLVTIFEAALLHALDAVRYKEDVLAVLTKYTDWSMQQIEDLGMQLLQFLLNKLQTMHTIPLIFENNLPPQRKVCQHQRKIQSPDKSRISRRIYYRHCTFNLIFSIKKSLF
uniref:F-box domain-containing protein n=1 Tax=Ditylenchus dipsaci TaxID=166011 RepID=A0A915CUM3_9BILA